MRILIFLCLSLTILSPVRWTEAGPIEDVDFEQLEDKIRSKRAPDYGGLGGPLAAGIREHKPDKDGENATAKPYAPQSNVNNSKKCDVVRMRKTVDEATGGAAKKRTSKEFDDYCKKYGKVYPSDEHKEIARKVFMSGKNGAHNLNGARCSTTDAQFGVTRYSDWTTEDFVQKLAGAREDSDPAQLPPPFSVTEDQSRFLYKLPQHDWRDYGVLPPIRDQKECGGCYAFSTTDLLATQERIDNKKFLSGDVESYSAQYFIDCMPEPNAYACKGGRPAAVLDYMASCKDCVILIERCYQYMNKNTRCKQASMNCKQSKGAKPVFSKQVNVNSNREAETIASLLRWGPVVAVVDLSPAWQYYNGTGIIRENHCDKKPNHAVLIVGYDYTGDVPYYIVRNSWSSDWGDHGTVKVEAGKNTCGIAFAALVTCTDKEKCGDWKEITDFINHPNVKPDLNPDGTFS